MIRWLLSWTELSSVENKFSQVKTAVVLPYYGNLKQYSLVLKDVLVLKSLWGQEYRIT